MKNTSYVRQIESGGDVKRIGSTPRAAIVAWAGLIAPPIMAGVALMILLDAGEFSVEMSRASEVVVGIALLLMALPIGLLFFRLSQLGVYVSPEALFISKLGVRKIVWEDIEHAYIYRTIRDPTLVAVKLRNGGLVKIQTSLFANQVLPGGSNEKSRSVVEAINDRTN